MILKLHNIILQIQLEEEFSTSVDAVIVSDDVNLIMRQGEIALKPKKIEAEDFKKILAQARKKLPKALGSVILAQGKEAIAYGKRFPATHLLIAIVYNFEKSPPCQKKFIEKALKACLKKAESLKVRTLALSPIGCEHKGISLEVFAKILSRLCLKSIKSSSSIKKIFLISSSPEERNLIIEYLSCLKAIKAIMPKIQVDKKLREM